MSSQSSSNYEYTWKVNATLNESHKLYEEAETQIVHLSLIVLIVCLALLVLNCYQEVTFMGGTKKFKERLKYFNMIYRLQDYIEDLEREKIKEEEEVDQI